MLRWAILGPGRIADRAIAPAMRACGHDLAVVASRSRTRAQAFAARHGVRRARQGYEAALDATDVDAVYVAVPNAFHERWTVAALDAGKHVLCEKPLAVDAAGAQRMGAAAVRADRVLMEALMTRFHPRTDALLEMVDRGDVGKVTRVDARFDGRVPAPGDHRLVPACGGGALLDLGVYAASTARWVVRSEPNDVRGLVQVGPHGADTAAAAVLGFGSGALAALQVGYAGPVDDRVVVVGTAGTLELPGPFTSRGNDEAILLRDGTPVGSWRADPYERMVRRFADVVSGRPGPLSPEDALATALVLDRWRAAAGAPTR